MGLLLLNRDLFYCTFWGKNTQAKKRPTIERAAGQNDSSGFSAARPRGAGRDDPAEKGPIPMKNRADFFVRKIFLQFFCASGRQ